jgi:hypothetical protein
MSALSRAGQQTRFTIQEAARNGHSQIVASEKEEAMERKTVERRSVLKGSVAAAAIMGSGASAAFAAVDDASAATVQNQLPRQIQTAIERFRATIPANFDPEYVEKVVVPFFSYERL